MTGIIIAYIVIAIFSAAIYSAIEDNAGFGIICGIIWPILLAGEIVNAIPEVKDYIRRLYND